MNPTIRRATEADVDAMYVIEQEGHARWNRRQFEDELSLAFSRVYIIENGSGIIGFAVVWLVADEIQLNNIGIRKERRREGHATKLLDRIISDAGTDGSPYRPSKLFLEVSARNMVAQMFYRNSGFIETGRRKHYYDGVDAILMERELRP